MAAAGTNPPGPTSHPKGPLPCVDCPACSCGAALVVGALAANPSRAAEPDKLLPADADTVVCVNIKQILDTDIIKKYSLEQLKQALDGQDAKKLLTELGLDPLKDIDRIVVGANIKGRTDIQVS